MRSRPETTVGQIKQAGQTFKASVLGAALERKVGDLELDLSSSEARWGDCAKIAALMDSHADHCALVAFKLADNCIGPEGITSICASKSLFRHLVSLNLENCLIESDGAAVVGSAIRDSQTLRKINLSRNNIGSYGAEAFAVRGLDGNVSLRELSLQSNSIGDPGMIALAVALAVHPSLTSLDMRDNLVGAEGMQVLSQTLCSDAVMLRRLNLNRNELQREGAAHVATFLAKNHRLIELDVSDNGLGGSKLDSAIVLSKGFDSLISLAEGLAMNKSLLRLNLRGNYINKLAMKALGDALAKNKVLSRLIVGGEAEFLPMITGGLKKNWAVTDLGCGEGLAKIAVYLARNQKHRDEFLKAVEAEKGLAKVQTTLDKGVDILGPDDDPLNVGPGFLVKDVKMPELINFYHTVPHLRNYLYSTTQVFRVLPSLSPHCLRAFAEQKEGMTMLLFAARSGHVGTVNLMLKNGADKNHADSLNRTALILATEYGHKSVVTALLARGASTESADFKLPLLLLAAKNGHANIVELLLEKFPQMMDVVSAPPKSRTALHVAAKLGRVFVCAVLLEMGMDPNKESGDGLAAMHMAASPEVCELLMNAGAFVKIKSQEDKDAVHYALFPEGVNVKPKLDVVTFLVEKGADQTSFDQVYELDVTNCYRDSLPSWIGKLANLTSLKAVEGNSLRAIPKNVVETGDEGLLDYLRDMSSGGQDIWKGFKIMVLGKEGVGKTHIYHLASGSAYPRDASTDGIDIHSFLLGQVKEPVTWFDFGGQEVFFPTHELFLTGQCVYLLVFKMIEADYAARIMYWLKVVTSFSMDKAKVVIVGTYKDKLKDPNADVAAIDAHVSRLTANSTTVVAKFYISCLDDPIVMGELVANALLAAAHQANLSGKEVPHIYTVIKEWAADQKQRQNARPYFTWDAFVECFPGYNHAILERACDFLHDMGAIFLAKRSIGNKKVNLVCVDIQWLATCFSAVVTFRHNWVKDGVLMQEALPHIWRDFGVVDMQDMLAIMSLYEKFNIAFAQRQEGSWIIPSMLSEEMPPNVTELLRLEEITHARQYRLSVVPSGAFGQVMARVSEWKDVTMKDLWRFGFVIRDSEDVAILTVQNGSELHLRICNAGDLEGRGIRQQLESSDYDVSGSKKADGGDRGSLLRRLDEELQQIFRFLYRRLPTLPVESFILCPHCIEAVAPEPKWIAYDHVVGLVISGETNYECEGKEVPLELIGEDLTLGYVHSFGHEDVTVDETPLARGGFGVVYKGHTNSRKNPRDIVVKELLFSGLSTGIQLFSDFQREVSLMAQLNHPNLVSMYGVMFCPLRMVLELCASGDLMNALGKELIDTVELQIRLSIDICEGMNYLHSLKPPLAHRDLRSPNVLLSSLDYTSRDPVAKVADFGLTVASSSRLKESLGTWQWMAPETFKGENYTEACDLYSFAMVMWEIWQGNGEIPFEALATMNRSKHAQSWMEDITHSDLRPACHPSFPTEISFLITKLWLRKPSDRPSFATSLEILRAVKGRKRMDEAQLNGIIMKAKLNVGDWKPRRENLEELEFDDDGSVRSSVRHSGFMRAIPKNDSATARASRALTGGVFQIGQRSRSSRGKDSDRYTAPMQMMRDDLDEDEDENDGGEGSTRSVARLSMPPNKLAQGGDGPLVSPRSVAALRGTSGLITRGSRVRSPRSHNSASRSPRDSNRSPRGSSRSPRESSRSPRSPRSGNSSPRPDMNFGTLYEGEEDDSGGGEEMGVSPKARTTPRASKSRPFGSPADLTTQMLFGDEASNESTPAPLVRGGRKSGSGPLAKRPFGNPADLTTQALFGNEDEGDGMDAVPARVAPQAASRKSAPPAKNRPFGNPADLTTQALFGADEDEDAAPPTQEAPRSIRRKPAPVAKARPFGNPSDLTTQALFGADDDNDNDDDAAPAHVAPLSVRRKPAPAAHNRPFGNPSDMTTQALFGDEDEESPPDQRAVSPKRAGLSPKRLPSADPPPPPPAGDRPFGDPANLTTQALFGDDDDDNVDEAPTKPVVVKKVLLPKRSPSASDTIVKPLAPRSTTSAKAMPPALRRTTSAPMKRSGGSALARALNKRTPASASRSPRGPLKRAASGVSTRSPAKKTPEPNNDNDATDADATGASNDVAPIDFDTMFDTTSAVDENDLDNLDLGTSMDDIVTMPAAPLKPTSEPGLNSSMDVIAAMSEAPPKPLPSPDSKSVSSPLPKRLPATRRGQNGRPKPTTKESDFKSSALETAQLFGADDDDDDDDDNAAAPEKRTLPTKRASAAVARPKPRASADSSFRSSAIETSALFGEEDAQVSEPDEPQKQLPTRVPATRRSARPNPRAAGNSEFKSSAIETSALFGDEDEDEDGDQGAVVQKQEPKKRLPTRVPATRRSDRPNSRASGTSAFKSSAIETSALFGEEEEEGEEEATVQEPKKRLPTRVPATRRSEARASGNSAFKASAIETSALFGEEEEGNDNDKVSEPEEPQKRLPTRVPATRRSARPNPRAAGNSEFKSSAIETSALFGEEDGGDGENAEAVKETKKLPIRVLATRRAQPRSGGDSAFKSAAIETSALFGDEVEGEGESEPVLAPVEDPFSEDEDEDEGEKAEPQPVMVRKLSKPLPVAKRVPATRRNGNNRPNPRTGDSEFKSSAMTTSNLFGEDDNDEEAVAPVVRDPVKRSLPTRRSNGAVAKPKPRNTANNEFRSAAIETSALFGEDDDDDDGETPADEPKSKALPKRVLATRKPLPAAKKDRPFGDRLETTQLFDE